MVRANKITHVMFEVSSNEQEAIRTVIDVAKAFGLSTHLERVDSVGNKPSLTMTQVNFGLTVPRKVPVATIAISQEGIPESEVWEKMRSVDQFEDAGLVSSVSPSPHSATLMATLGKKLLLLHCAL